MKRYIAGLLALILALCISPCAFASVELRRPEPGQLIYINADESEVYTADFYLAALSDARRAEDDLVLYLDNARIELRGFFSGAGNSRRGVEFKDGASITATDFDSEGKYLGQFSSIVELAKSTDFEKYVDASDSPLLVKFSRIATEITRNGLPVFGALRANALSTAQEFIANGGDDWNKVRVLTVEFKVGDDESVSIRKERLMDVDGLSAVNLRPQIVWMPDCRSLVPLAVGRSTISFTNELETELQTLSVRVSENGGGLDVACVCPYCGGNQECALHMLPCGHYSCADDVKVEEHAVAECGYAGHCITDGAVHSTCSNCLKPLCNGQEHGKGICLHEHTWVQQSYRAPTATESGESVSRCVTCGISYKHVLPALGA